MNKVKRTHVILFIGILLGVIIFTSSKIYGQDTDDRAQIPEGVYIKLTKDFYDALINENSRGTKVYTNNPSQEYLKQIAISARFLVETNLQILKQQEKILELLNSHLENKKK
jgi:hypothetical protein